MTEITEDPARDTPTRGVLQAGLQTCSGMAMLADFNWEEKSRRLHGG